MLFIIVILLVVQICTRHTSDIKTPKNQHTHSTQCGLAYDVNIGVGNAMCSGDYTQQLWLTPRINAPCVMCPLESMKLEPLGTGRSKIKILYRVKAYILSC